MTAATGCKPSNPLGRVPISGKVTLDTKPLDHGMIEFWPEDSPGETGSSENKRVKISSGAVVANGEYRIEKLQGLPPGKYRVRVFAPQSDGPPPNPNEAPGPGGRPGIERIPPQYNIQSAMIFEVAAGKPNQYDVDVRQAGR